MFLVPSLASFDEQAMAETTKKIHRRERSLTRRTLQGCWGVRPAWWVVNKQNTLCFQFAAAANHRTSALGWGGGGVGKGTRFESYITCYVAQSNYYVMYYFDFPNCYITCHMTCYTTHSICYIPPLLYNIRFVIYPLCYITFGLFLYNALYLLYISIIIYIYNFFMVI